MGGEMSQTSTSRADPLPITLHLEVNRSISSHIYRNEPIVLTVRITSYQSVITSEKTAELEWRRRALRQSFDAGEVSEEEYSRRMKELDTEFAAPPSVRIGSKQMPWWSLVDFSQVTDGQQPLDWPLHLLGAYPQEEETVLEEANSYSADFGVDAEEVARIPPGTYRVVASLDREVKIGSEVARIQIKSNDVSIELLSEEMPGEEASKPERKTELARYYMRRGKHNVAENLVRGLETIEGLMLIGEISEMKGEYEEAFKAYKRAEEQFYVQYPDSYEGPEIIASKIIDLLRKWKPEKQAEG